MPVSPQSSSTSNSSLVNEIRSLAEFTEFAVQQHDPTIVIQRAALLISSTMPVDHVIIGEFMTGDKGITVRAGIGVDDQQGSQIGQLISGRRAEIMDMLSNDIVIVGSKNTEASKFVEHLFKEKNIKGGIGLAIPGKKRPWGILAACSSERRMFRETDGSVLRSIASVLSTTIERIKAERERQAKISQVIQAKQEWESTVDSLPQIVCLLDSRGHIVRANRVLESWGLCTVADARHRDIHEILHPQCGGDGCELGSLLSSICARLEKEDELEWDTDDQILGRALRFNVRKVSMAADTPGSRAVLVIDDITEHRAAKLALIHYNRELEKKVKERTAQLIVANEYLEKEKETLAESEKELHILSHQLITAQENERKRIALELHDGLGQSLSAIKFRVETSISQLGKKNPECDNCNDGALSEVVRKIQNTIEEVRKISMDLRPSTLDDLGTVITIEWFCREYKATYPSIEIVKEIDAIESDIPDILKIVIYRIIQEAFNNIAKYANATIIQLKLEKNEEDLCLCIADNGDGFNVDSCLSAEMRRPVLSNSEGRLGGLGLRSMRERTEFTGGKFKIDSVIRKGTTIEAIWNDSKAAFLLGD